MQHCCCTLWASACSSVIIRMSEYQLRASLAWLYIHKASDWWFPYRLLCWSVMASVEYVLWLLYQQAWLCGILIRVQMCYVVDLGSKVIYISEHPEGCMRKTLAVSITTRVKGVAVHLTWLRDRCAGRMRNREFTPPHVVKERSISTQQWNLGPGGHGYLCRCETERHMAEWALLAITLAENNFGKTWQSSLGPGSYVRGISDSEITA